MSAGFCAVAVPIVDHLSRCSGQRWVYTMDLTRRHVLNALGMLTGASILGRNAAGAAGSRVGEQVAQAPSLAPSAAGLALVLRFRDGSADSKLAITRSIVDCSL